MNVKIAKKLIGGKLNNKFYILLLRSYFMENFLKNLRAGLTGFLITSSLNSCIIPHLISLKKYSPLTAEQKDSLFYDLNSGLTEYLDRAYIVTKEDFNRKKISAHVHHKTLDICFKEGFSKRDVVHEPAHVRHLALDKAGAEFSKEWREIANFEYGKKVIEKNNLFPFVLSNIKWRDKTTGPKYGFLNPESTKNIYEDVANFVESLAYEYPPEFIRNRFNEENKFFIKICPMYFCNPEDKRYQEKLNLLKKYNFLTEEEHNNLSAKLGILYNLIEKKYIY